MALAINNNLMANNVTRNLQTHYSELGKSTQRLSSGLRVSSAADDAAGLAIRELMRGDIAALGQGVRNANDAISMIQTADGALGVIDSKLIRMKELAEQSSSDTYTDDQRKLINQEYQAMSKEITRIAEDTDFNGKKLLDGDKGSYETIKGSITGGGSKSVDGVHTTYVKAAADIVVTNENRFGIKQVSTFDGAVGKELAMTQTNAGGRITLDKDNSTVTLKENTVESGTNLNTKYAAAKAAGTLTVETSADGKTWTKQDTTTDVVTTAGHHMRISIDDGHSKRQDTITNGAAGVITFAAAGSFSTTTAATGEISVATKESTTTNVHFGSSSAKTDSYDVEIGRSTSTALGVGAGAQDDVLTRGAAKVALDNIDKAISMKDSTRADLGSTQNRLTATIDNISVQKENLQAAESRISDVDVATEMTEFNKQQILANAAVSMLSQANNLPKMAQKLLG